MNLLQRGIDRIVAVIGCALLLTPGARAADLFDPPERYPINFTFQLIYKNAGQTTTLMGQLPTPRNPSGPKDGALDLIQKGRTEHRQRIDAKQSQALVRLLATTLASYTLPPTNAGPKPGAVETLSIIVSPGYQTATFVFVRPDAAQWKKAAEAWETIRALFPAPQIDAIPIP